eukprot:scaffold1483_cov374-Pavlova_lutheri.AAC.9
MWLLGSPSCSVAKLQSQDQRLVCNRRKQSMIYFKAKESWRKTRTEAKCSFLRQFLVFLLMRRLPDHVASTLEQVVSHQQHFSPASIPREPRVAQLRRKLAEVKLLSDCTILVHASRSNVDGTRARATLVLVQNARPNIPSVSSNRSLPTAFVRTGEARTKSTSGATCTSKTSAQGKDKPSASLRFNYRAFLPLSAPTKDTSSRAFDQAPIAEHETREEEGPVFLLRSPRLPEHGEVSRQPGIASMPHLLQTATLPCGVGRAHQGPRMSPGGIRSFFPPCWHSRHEGGQHLALVLPILPQSGPIGDERHVHATGHGIHLRHDAWSEERLELGQSIHPLFHGEFGRFEFQDQGILSVHHFLSQGTQFGSVPPGYAFCFPVTEDPFQRLFEVLFVSVPVPGRILSHLFLDVGGFGLPQLGGLCCGFAGHGFEFCVLECESHDGRWESVDEHEGGQASTGQQVEVCAEAVHEQAHAGDQSDGAEGHPGDAELIVHHHVSAFVPSVRSAGHPLGIDVSSVASVVAQVRLPCVGSGVLRRTWSIPLVSSGSFPRAWMDAWPCAYRSAGFHLDESHGSFPRCLVFLSFSVGFGWVPRRPDPPLPFGGGGWASTPVSNGHRWRPSFPSGSNPFSSILPSLPLGWGRPSPRIERDKGGIPLSPGPSPSSSLLLSYGSVGTHSDGKGTRMDRRPESKGNGDRGSDWRGIHPPSQGMGKWK